MKQRLKDFWQKYEPKVILILGFILVASLSFQAGLLRGRNSQISPLVIEKPVPQGLETVQEPAKAQNLAQAISDTQNSNNTTPKDCAFVGSKNSNKFHLPTCRWAKNIKPENLACFKSLEEAKAKGYLPDSNCIK